MAFSHGKSATLGLGSAGAESTITQVENFCDEIGVPQEIETGETTTFGQGAKTYVSGLRDGTISLSGKFDPVIDLHLYDLAGHETPVDFEYGPTGDEVGDVQYSGSAYLTSYEVTSPVADVVTFSAELQVTGLVARSTF